MNVAAKTCGECGRRYFGASEHAERCRGPRVRLRQPVYHPADWTGLMADQDADDLRVAPYLGGPAEDAPWERRH